MNKNEFERATTGLRRPTAELTDANHDNCVSSSDNSANDSSARPHPTEPVVMEISSSPPLADLEKENMIRWRDREEEEPYYPECLEIQQKDDLTTAEGEGGERDRDECDYLVFETGVQREVVEMGEMEEGEKDADGRQKEDTGQETEIRKEVSGNGSEGSPQCGSRKSKEVDERRDKNTCEDKVIEGTNEDAGSVDATDADTFLQDVKANVLEEFPFLSKSPAGHTSSLEAMNPLGSSKPPAAATQNQEDWAEDPSHPDDLSDCLQAELAIVYSDSDAGDDQWGGLAPCDITRQREKCGVTSDGVCDEESKEEKRGEKNHEHKTERKRREEVERRVSRNYDDEEQMRTRRDYLLRSPSVSSTASSIDPERKAPADFSVHQDNLSDNVSTEHVDFLLARQQWKKMEEEVRGRPIPKPGHRAQGSFQGTHTSLYPPTRSPRLKHRELQQPVPREPPLSFTLSPSSEDSGLEDSSSRSPLEEPETAVEREIRLTLEREERHRRERGMIAQGLTIPRPTNLPTGRSPPRPPACRTPTLSISPSPSPSSCSSLTRSVYHEMTANNVIILEPDCSGSGSRSRMLSTAIGGLSDWPASLDVGPSANVIVVETSNLIIRSASEFCLSTTPVPTESQESTFSSNPFFKLRSLSSQSLVEREIRMVRQREEEWRKQREEMWRRQREEEWKRGREKYDTVLVSPGLSDTISYNVPEVSDRSVSSPSSPSRTRKMDRSSLSCDHKWFS